MIANVTGLSASMTGIEAIRDRLSRLGPRPFVIAAFRQRLVVIVVIIIPLFSTTDYSRLLPSSAHTHVTSI